MKLVFPPKEIRLKLGISSFVVVCVAYFIYLLLEFGLAYTLGPAPRAILAAVYSILFLSQLIIIPFVWVILATLWVWFLSIIFWAPYHSVKDRVKSSGVAFPSSLAQILLWSLGATLGFIFEIIMDLVFLRPGINYSFECGFVAWLLGTMIWMIRNRKKNKPLD